MNYNVTNSDAKILDSNGFTSIALSCNIQVPALVLRELGKPTLQELQIVSGFRNSKQPKKNYIGLQVKDLQKKKWSMIW